MRWRSPRLPGPSRNASSKSGGELRIELHQAALRVMEEHRIRRLPVIDNDRPVGMISEADLARHLPEQSLAEFVETICASS